MCYSSDELHFSVLHYNDAGVVQMFHHITYGQLDDIIRLIRKSSLYRDESFIMKKDLKFFILHKRRISIEDDELTTIIGSWYNIPVDEMSHVLQSIVQSDTWDTDRSFLVIDVEKESNG